MTKLPGIGNRKRLKEEMAQFKDLQRIMRGDEVAPPIKRKPQAPRTKKNDMAEKRLEGQIILHLKLAGCEVAKSGESSEYNSQYVMNGMSDLLCFVPGHGVLFLECKLPMYKSRKNGGLRDSQVKFKELCKKCNIRYEVVYSVKDALDIVRGINPIDKPKPIGL